MLAPDLPGHGAEGSDGKVSLARCAQSIAQCLEEYAGETVLVGHSMGGMVISAAAAQAPGKVASAVYLAAFLPRVGESVFSLMASMRQAGAPLPVEDLMSLSPDRRFYAIDPAVAASLFYGGCAGPDREWAVERLRPQPVLPLSGKLSRDAVGIPRVYVSCLHDRVIPIGAQRRMAARFACELLQLDAGHSPFLSHVEELARILESV